MLFHESLPARRFPWLTLALVAAGGLAAAWPRAGTALQFDRRLVAAGEAWRLLTAQLVHWTARMSVADLGALLVLGSWLESQARRRQAAAALAAALAATAAFLPLSHLDLYRGSSGLGSALLVLAALAALSGGGASRGARGLAALALAGFAAKLLLDASGIDLAGAGPLPAGVAAAPAAHFLGAAAGALAFTTVAPAGSGHQRQPANQPRG
jgi:hypothetical protein